MPVADDVAWTRLARAQHGVISRTQLRRCGLSADQIARLVRRSLLVRERQGVYRAAPAQASFESTLWVAVLATGGLLSGTTASYLWEMLDHHSGPIRVVVPRHRRLAPLVGIQVLRRDLRPAVRDSRYGLPVTARAIAAI
ncbi:MAG TPA: type IV toxin-antitoxin system AbiEi family antitoxin domain-containing protein, partial [Jatrophihabitans sp.]|nr:type IV toxin-antitoxin system AbiEi family antitoxin domain-containing protein [Jatrophihabitans sp.]